MRCARRQAVWARLGILTQELSDGVLSRRGPSVVSSTCTRRTTFSAICMVRCWMLAAFPTACWLNINLDLRPSGVSSEPLESRSATTPIGSTGSQPDSVPPPSAIRSRTDSAAQGRASVRPRRSWRWPRPPCRADSVWTQGDSATLELLDLVGDPAKPLVLGAGLPNGTLEVLLEPLELGGKSLDAAPRQSVPPGSPVFPPLAPPLGVRLAQRLDVSVERLDRIQSSVEGRICSPTR